jgi:hypothetical protein
MSHECVCLQLAAYAAWWSCIYVVRCDLLGAVGTSFGERSATTKTVFSIGWQHISGMSTNTICRIQKMVYLLYRLLPTDTINGFFKIKKIRAQI